MWRVAGLLLLLTVQAGSTCPATEQLPGKEGVYVWRGAEGWERLYRALLDDKKSKGMERFLQTDGQTALNLTLTFDGSNSPIKLADPRPAFFLRGIAAADDTLIVQLESRKDMRQARTSSVLVGTNNREGFRAADVRRVRVSEAAKGWTAITPQENLKNGEYLLVFGRVDNAFDFGIQVR